MNSSITNKPSTNHRRLIPPIENKSSTEICHLLNSIKNICHQPYDTLDDIFKSSNQNSTLGKLYQLFLSLQDPNDQLLNPNIFDDLIKGKTKDLRTKKSMNFLQFLERIQILAKENQVSREYIYHKLFNRRFSSKNTNALHSYLISSNEYTNDLSRLKNYFITKTNSHNQMNCSTFVECICRDLHFNQIDIRLELNDLFYRIQSLLVHQGVYIPGSLTIDFHGFILCLQQIAQTFQLNLRILIKNFK